MTLRAEAVKRVRFRDAPIHGTTASEPVGVEYTITPPRGVLRINWVELWRFRDLFLTLAWRDISVRYKQAVLGAAWAILQPLTTMVVFTLVFNRMANLQSNDGTPYPVFLYVGTLFWQYYSATLTHAADSMVANAALIQKVYFPRLVVPAAAAIAGLVDFLVASTVLVGLMFWFRITPAVTGVLILPILLLIAVLASLGVGLLLASLNIKYRDVRYALPFLINILMYVTPVIYPVEMLNRYPVAHTVMLWANPISAVISNARAGLLGRTAVDWPSIGIALAMSIVFFVAGLYYFRNTERYFADLA
jgi:lipopolysaccharide transport system permease protein